MSSNAQLDLKDRKILYQLDINARQPNSAIAKKVGLSKEVVHYRIQKLESCGIIKGYYTIIDFAKLGYTWYRVYIKLMNATPEKQEEMMTYLVNMKKTMFVEDIEGPYDIGCSIMTKSSSEFKKEYQKFKEKYCELIEVEQISLFTKAHHFHRAYLLGYKRDDETPNMFGEEGTVYYDSTDKKILSLIAKNSRISATELSTKLKITDRAILYRLRELEKKKIIQGYRFICDFQKYDYQYYKVDMILKNISRIRELITYARLHPNILYVDETIGGSDFEFDMEVKSKDEFIKIMNEIRTRFPEIRSWKYFTLNSFRKLLYFPEE